MHGLRITDPLAMETEVNQWPGVVTVGIFARHKASLCLLGTDAGRADAALLSAAARVTRREARRIDGIEQALPMRQRRAGEHRGQHFAGERGLRQAARAERGEQVQAAARGR